MPAVHVVICAALKALRGVNRLDRNRGRGKHPFFGAQLAPSVRYPTRAGGLGVPDLQYGSTFVLLSLAFSKIEHTIYVEGGRSKSGTHLRTLPLHPRKPPWRIRKR